MVNSTSYAFKEKGDGTFCLNKNETEALICDFESYNPTKVPIYAAASELKNQGKQIGCDETVFDELKERLSPELQMLMKVCSGYDDNHLHQIIRKADIGLLHKDAINAIAKGISPEKYVENKLKKLNALKLT